MINITARDGTVLHVVQATTLRGANLCGADLRGANLGEADLRGADLRGADLREANLCGANLRGANLCGANLREADLREADLRGADLWRVNLEGIIHGELVYAQTSIVPPTGSFEGWKQCRDGVLVHLLVPTEARRSNATGRKCRAEAVEVLAVVNATEGISLYDATVIYRTGDRVVCNHWEESRWVECGGGIHFYLTRCEAEHHQ